MGFSDRDRRAVIEAWTLARTHPDTDQLADLLIERWGSVGGLTAVAGAGQLPEQGVSVVHVWPARRHGAEVVSGTVGLLRSCARPWRLEVDRHPARGLGRVVAWVEDGELAEVAVGLWGLTRRRTLPGTPVFSCALAPGVAWAEAEPSGASWEGFELCRARLLAEVLQTVPRGWGVPEVLDAAAERFREAGIDPAAPHLRARRLLAA